MPLESSQAQPPPPQKKKPLLPSAAALAKSLSSLARIAPAAFHQGTLPAHLPHSGLGALDKVPRTFPIKPDFRASLSNLVQRYLPALAILHIPSSHCAPYGPPPVFTYSFCLDRPVFSPGECLLIFLRPTADTASSRVKHITPLSAFHGTGSASLRVLT